MTNAQIRMTKTASAVIRASSFVITKWQVASVLPGVGWVLETRQRADAQPVENQLRIDD